MSSQDMIYREKNNAAIIQEMIMENKSSKIKMLNFNNAIWMGN